MTNLKTEHVFLDPCIMQCNLRAVLTAYGKRFFCIAIMGRDHYYQNIQTDIIQCPFIHT